MLIDWFTVIAQVFNFLVLVWLMKRFLYQPVLKALDAREQRIARELEDARHASEAAATERSEYQQRRAEFEQQHATLLDHARAEAAAERQRLLDEARSRAEELRKRLDTQLDAEYRNLNHEIARQAQQEVFSITRKVLSELSDTALEQRLVEVFLARLKDAGNIVQGELSALAVLGGEAILRSAFALPSPLQEKIRSTMANLAGRELAIRFEIEPSLIAGIELYVHGRKLAWSVSEHLHELEQSLNRLLRARNTA